MIKVIDKLKLSLGFVHFVLFYHLNSSLFSYLFFFSYLLPHDPLEKKRPPDKTQFAKRPPDMTCNTKRPPDIASFTKRHPDEKKILGPRERPRGQK